MPTATQSPDGVIAAFNDLKAYLNALPPSPHVLGQVPLPGTVGFEDKFVIATPEQQDVINAKIQTWALEIQAQQAWYNQAGIESWKFIYATDGSAAILGVKKPFIERRIGPQHQNRR